MGSATVASSGSLRRLDPAPGPTEQMDARLNRNRLRGVTEFSCQNASITRLVATNLVQNFSPPCSEGMLTCSRGRVSRDPSVYAWRTSSVEVSGFRRDSLERQQSPFVSHQQRV